jgi:hypothetical protein
MATNSLQKFWWAAGAFLVLMAGLLLPTGELLQADSRAARGSSSADGWEIELVPRSAGPAASTASSGRERVSEPRTNERSTGEPLTPAEKGWEEVESPTARPDRAVPLNAVRAGSAVVGASRQTVERAQPLIARSPEGSRPTSQTETAFRNVSSSRSSVGRRAPSATAEVPSARLMTPKFARREAVPPPEALAAAAEATEAKPQAPTQPPIGPAPARPWQPAMTRSRDSQRPLAGELPAEVSADDRAEPLMSSDSRAVASDIARRRTQRVQKSIEIPDDAVTKDEPRVAESQPRVMAPDPQSADEPRRMAMQSGESIPLAGHSLFVDPLPLAPNFTGTSVTSPGSSQTQGPGTMIHDSRYGWIRVNSMDPPWVVPRNAIPHTGWYGPQHRVRSISHSVPDRSVMPGHSVMDR